MIRTERRMPIPENTTVAGESTWRMKIGSLIIGDSQMEETNETNTLTNKARERI